MIFRPLITALLLLVIVQPLSAALVAERIGVLEGGANQPTDVAVTEDGRAYLLDGVNGRVIVFKPAGGVDFIIKPIGSAALNLPMGLTIGERKLYIADSGNHRIAVFDLKGRFLRVIPLATGKQLPEPVSILYEERRLFWSDRKNHQVCQTDLKQQDLTRCWGKQGRGKGEFDFPFQLAVDEQGYLQVVDVINARVQQFNFAGRPFFQLGGLGLADGQLYRPNGLAFSSSGQLLVSDAYLGSISLYQKNRFTGLLQNKQGQPLQFSAPVGLTIWRDQLYVVDSRKNRVERFRLTETADQTKQHIGRVTEDRSCVSCHLSWADGYQSADRGIKRIPPVASLEMCYSCHHGVVVESRLDIGQGEQHPDIHFPLENQPEEREDKLPKRFPQMAGELYCGSCHTPHNVEVEQAKLEHNPWLRVLDQDGDLCQRCHESKLDSRLDKKQPPSGINHPVGLYLKQPPTDKAEGYATAEALWKGLPKKLVGAGVKLGSQQQMICQSCHQMHGATAKMLLPIENQNGQLCESCHQRHTAKSLEEAREKGIHPVNIDMQEPVKMGDVEVKRITCLTCHSAHDGIKGRPSLRFDHLNGKLCSFCHEGLEAVAKSDHDLRKTAKTSKNRFGENPEKGGVCGSCHTLHRGDASLPFLFAGKTAPYPGEEHTTQQDRLCLSCHQKEGVAEGAIVELFSHPREDMVLRSAPDIMPLLQEGEIKEFGEIACITCHNPHRWTAHKDQTSPTEENSAGDISNSFLRLTDLKGTFCVECHGLEARSKYKYYHDKVVRDIGVDYLK
jgi:predicted CXXCH cytochrome family protein